jgi:hypothetical protein
MSVVDVESPDEGFEALCASLERNDPNVTSIGPIGAPLHVPPGQIRRVERDHQYHGTDSLDSVSPTITRHFHR